MTAKTTFWYAAFVALAVIGSALAVPLTTVDAAAANNNEDEKPSNVQPEFQEQLKSSADSPVVSNPSEGIAVDPSLQQQQQQQQQKFGPTDAVSAGSDQPLSETDPSLSAAVNEKIDSDVPATVGSDTSDAGKLADNVGGINSSPPSPAAGSVQTPDSPAVGSNPPKPAVGHDQTPPKPYFPVGNVETVKIGLPALPYFMQFFQPFTAFQPFPPFTHDINRNQPFRQQYHMQHQPQFPFGASIGPFDPFPNPMRTPSINQLVNEYTNEFRNMLASLSKDMSQAENTGGDGKEVANKPVTKTTSKTEIIDGHVVQINETTYSDGDADHKSFYHFKQIQVVPEGTDGKKIVGNDNDKAVTTAPATAANDPETLKVNTNEIVPDLSVETFSVDNQEDKQNQIKKVDQ